MSADAFAMWIGYAVMGALGLAAAVLAIAASIGFFARRAWHSLTLAYDLRQLREQCDQLRASGKLKNRRLQNDEMVE